MREIKTLELVDFCRYFKLESLETTSQASTVTNLEINLAFQLLKFAAFNSKILHDLVTRS